LASFNAKDGSIYKQGRVEGAVDAYFASPVLADGKPSAQWEVLSVGDFGEEIWATPAAADHQLFVRTQKTLYCFEIPKA
jgi:hypothetical protein